jgi:hypothetical protein
MENFKNNDDYEEMTLLQTIKIPKNLGFLTDKLPQANYEKIPNKRNLSFTNNNNEKGKNKLKKNIKKLEISKDNQENRDNKDKNEEENNNNINNANANKIHAKKDKDKDNDLEEDIISNKRKKHGSLDQSHISGNNGANIKHIKNTENIEVNNSLIKERDRERDRDRDRDRERDKDRERDRDREIEREKSSYADREKRIKEINSNNVLNLPNIKNKGSLDDMRGRNKYIIKNKILIL